MSNSQIVPVDNKGLHPDKDEQTSLVSFDGVYSSKKGCSAKHRHSRCVYTNEGYKQDEMESIHTQFTSVSRCIEKSYEHKHINKGLLNKQIDRIWAFFLAEVAIYHACVAIKGFDVSNPEGYRQACIRALNRSGIKRFVIFGLEPGDNGIWHFHIVYQGSFRSYWSVFHRTGMSYHKFKNDRKEFIELNSEAMDNEPMGFHATVKYCLEKHHANKRNYIRVNIKGE